MKRTLIFILSAVFLVVAPLESRALFGVGDVVYDPAAVAQLIEQVRKTLAMINELKSLNDKLQSLNDWEKLDHVNLAGQKFTLFVGQYKKLFDDVIHEINDYQGGGLMGAIDALESRYPSYHNDWEAQDKLGDSFYDKTPPELAEKVHAMKKQLLLTKIQMKHALIVGAKIRDSLPKAEAQTQALLDDTKQAVGVMQTIKIGSELTSMVAKSLQSLNLQMGEYLQAYAAKELEENQRKGALANRAREALSDFGSAAPNQTPVPLNPIGKF